MKKNIFKFLKLILFTISLLVAFILFSLIWNYYSGIPLPSEKDKSIYHTGILIEQYEPQIKEARLILDEWKNKFYTPGYSISVGYKDEVIWSEAFGYSDLEKKIPTRVDSKFPIGSVTKTFTAMAIMDLVEQGKIELTNKIQDYVPSFPEKKHPINIHHLLTHTSGIRHYNPIIKWPPPYVTIDSRLDQTFETTEKKLALFANDTLLFKPGTDYSYSTYGYTLLGEVIKSVTGMSFNSYMSETMFAPLGMTNTTPDYFNHKIKNRVVSYNNTIIGSRVIKSEKENCSYKWAGGGYLSTPTDVVRFSLAVLNNRIVKKNTFEKMLAPLNLYKGSPFPQYHAIGWDFIPRKKQEIRVVNKTGSPTGGQSCIVMIPESGIVVHIATNSYIYGSLPLKRAATKISYLFHSDWLIKH